MTQLTGRQNWKNPIHLIGEDCFFSMCLKLRLHYFLALCVEQGLMRSHGIERS